MLANGQPEATAPRILRVSPVDGVHLDVDAHRSLGRRAARWVLEA